MSIEAAGPLAHYDVGVYNPPFTLKASPFQLRGLAAHVVKSCVAQNYDQRRRPIAESDGKGGFATHQIKNLANYVTNSDDLTSYRMSTSSSPFFLQALGSKHLRLIRLHSINSMELDLFYDDGPSQRSKPS